MIIHGKLFRCMKLTALLFVLLQLFPLGSAKAAALSLASPFTEHMVIQRNKPIQVWGLATPSKMVSVQLGDQQAEVKAGEDGNWKATLKPLPAGGPFLLTATSEAEKTVVADILIGDVWLCSGQSNMQFSLQECDDAQNVLKIPHPRLRLGHVDTAWTATPQSNAKIHWSNSNVEEAKKFSAVAYTFAHELESDPAMADVPIGLLEDCLGATVIESWLPSRALAGFDPKELQNSMFGIGPTLLYNGMIAPLGETAFAGVIWYQGEGNAGEPQRYSKLLPLLFATWREQLHDPKLPFLVVQLPDYATDWGGIYWQWMREAQANAVTATPDTYFAVTLNTNDGWNLHPQGKHEIGRRLSLLARKEIYGEKIVGEGPRFKSVESSGSNLIVHFDAQEDGLSSGYGPLNGFMVAGKNGDYHVAQALVDGDKVVLSSNEVAAPQTVRYAWAGVPHGSLTNQSGLPAAPFRTDTLSPIKGLPEPQLQPAGYTLRGEDFAIDVSGEGRITNLILKHQQFISNAPANWGSTSFSNRTLQQIKLIGAQTLLCTGQNISLKLETSLHQVNLTITNTGTTDATIFKIALANGVEVSGDPVKGLNLKRKNATLRITNVTRVTQFHDDSAEDGKVLEVDVSAGASRLVSVDLSQ